VTKNNQLSTQEKKTASRVLNKNPNTAKNPLFKTPKIFPLFSKNLETPKKPNHPKFSNPKKSVYFKSFVSFSTPFPKNSLNLLAGKFNEKHSFWKTKFSSTMTSFTERGNLKVMFWSGRCGKSLEF
jgi:hypothetical protein